MCATAVSGLERISFSASSSGDTHVTAVRAGPVGKALYSARADIVGGNGAECHRQEEIAVLQTPYEGTGIHDLFAVCVHRFCTVCHCRLG